MTNFVKIWKNYLNEQLLIEGRYDKALEYALNMKKMAAKKKGNKPGVEDVLAQMSEGQILKFKESMARAINFLRDEDPTGSNTYLMWAARYLRYDLFRMLQKYSKNWGTDPISWRDDPGGAPNIDDLKERVVTRAISLSPSLKDYHSLKMRNLAKKDIMSYDPTNEIGEFTNDVAMAKRDLEARIQRAELEQQTEEDRELVSDPKNKDYKTTRAYSADASCYLGAGSGDWCISRTKSENYFETYSKQGKVFYFLTMRHLSERNPNKNMVLQWDKDQPSGDEPESVWDAPNRDVGTIGLLDAVEENLLTKLLKHPDIAKPGSWISDRLGEIDYKKDDPLTIYHKVSRLRDHVAVNMEKAYEASSEEDRSTTERGSREAQREDPPTLNEGVEDLMAKLKDEIGIIGRQLKDEAGAADDIDYKKFDRLAGPLSRRLTALKYAKVLGLEVENAAQVDEAFKKLVQKEYEALYKQGAEHFPDNPPDERANADGPTLDDYRELYDQYVANFRAISLNEPDTYDNENFHFGNASWSIQPTEDWLEDLHLAEDIDLQDFAAMVQDALENVHIYPDSRQADGHPDTVTYYFEQNYDESSDLDGYEDFLRRMDELDDQLIPEGIKESIAEAAMDQGLTTGGIREFSDKLEELDLDNVEFDITGAELNIELHIKPVLARPQGVSDEDFEALISDLAGHRTSETRQTVSDRALAKIEQAIRDKYEDFYNQLALPGEAFDKDRMETPPEDALPIISMEFFALPDHIKAYTADETTPMRRSEPGVNITYPHNFVLWMTNQEYWETLGAEEDEEEATLRFIKWLDNPEIVKQITAIHQAELNDVALEWLKENSPEPEPAPTDPIPPGDKNEDPGFVQQVAEEQQLQELYKRWAKMIR